METVVSIQLRISLLSIRLARSIDTPMPSLVMIKNGQLSYTLVGSKLTAGGTILNASRWEQ
jgi:hypothetical protein